MARLLLFARLVFFFTPMFAVIDLARAQSPVLRVGGALAGDIVWSSDGQMLVVAASDAVRLYQRENWTTPIRTFPGALDALFVPDTLIELDGQRYVILTGEVVPTPEAPIGETSNVSSAVSSPSGRLVAQPGYGDENFPIVRLMDSQTPDASPIDLRVAPDSTVERMVFSPDERYIVVNYFHHFDRRNYLQLWELSPKRLVFDTTGNSGSTYREIRFGLDSLSLLVLEGIDGDYDVYGESMEYIYVWDVPTGQQIVNRLGSWSDEPYSVSADGEWIAYNAAYPNGTLLVWNGFRLIDTGFMAAELYFDSATVFSADGHVLAANGQGGEIGIWEIDKENRELTHRGSLPKNDKGSALGLVLSGDGSLLLYETESALVQLWDVEHLSLIAELPTDQSLESVAFSPDAKQFIIQDPPLDSATLWSAAGKLLGTFPVDVQVAPDWTYMAHWDDGTLVIYNLATSETMREVLLDDYPGMLVATDPQHRYGLFERNDGLDAYRFDDGTLQFSIPLNGTAASITFSADGSRLAVLDAPPVFRTSMYKRPSQHIVVWDTAAPGRLLSTIELESLPHVVALSPDGAHVVAYGKYLFMGRAHTVIYDAVSGEQVALWEQDIGAIDTFVFHPTAPLLAAFLNGWQRGTLILLDIPLTVGGAQSEGVARLFEPLFADSASNLRFSPQGGFLINEFSRDEWCLVDLRDLPTAGALFDTWNRRRCFAQASSIVLDFAETTILVKDINADEASLHPLDGGTTVTLPATTSAIALNADASYVATVTADGVSAWNVSAVRNGGTTPLAVFPLPDLNVTELTFDADNRLIVYDPSGASVYTLP